MVLPFVDDTRKGGQTLAIREDSEGNSLYKARCQGVDIFGV